MGLSADLLLKGGTLLQEACPRCGGVQIRYQGKVYCLAEDNIEDITKSSAVPAQKEAPAKTSESSSTLRKMLEEKLATVTKQLDATTDIQEQTKLLDLISKYIETLQKLEKSWQNLSLLQNASAAEWAFLTLKKQTR
jgi:UPF0148 protein